MQRIIETEIWEENPEKKGYVRFVECRKVYDVFKDLYASMKENNMMPDEYFNLNYRFDEDSVMPRDPIFAVNTMWGSNEGVYIDVEMIAGGERIRFATGKTLGETEEDYDRMSAIAAFVYKSFAGFGRVPSDKKEEAKVYTVCIDSSYLRDTQYFNPRGLSDETFEYMGTDDENYWGDIGLNAFVDIVVANSEKDACRKVANKHGYDERTMFAVEGDCYIETRRKNHEDMQ